MPPSKFVVIGGDAAGMSAAGRAKRRLPDLDVLVFEKSGYVSYGACGIPYFIEGEVKELEDLIVVRPEEFIEKRGIMVKLHHEVARIFPERKAVLVRDHEAGREFEERYDNLLISTGARPIVPAGVDPHLPGVFTVRGLPEARGLMDFIRENSPKEAVIAGGGYIGVEMAEALVARGLKVKMLQSGSRVMRIMEEEISALSEETLKRNGVEVHTGQGIKKVKAEGNGLRVETSEGFSYSTDLVVIAIGVLPVSELAKDAGLELGVKGAIKVDRRQRTSDPSIYAAGDCAEAFHLMLNQNAFIPLALTANRAGRVAGSVIAGEDQEFPGILGSAVTKIFDLTVARTGLGLQEAKSAGFDAAKSVVTGRSRAHYMPGAEKITTILIFEKSGGRLLGAQMAGTEGVAQRINIFAAALTRSMTLAEIQDLDLAYAPPFNPVWDPVLVSAEVSAKKVK